MTKRMVNASIVYALLGLAGGVFYRELTKALHYDGPTALSAVHGHYLVLGMAFFLLLALLERAFGFMGQKRVPLWLALYHAGLNVTVAGLLARGLADATGAVLSRALDGAISGVSGLGHLLLAVGLIGILWALRKKAA